MNYPMIFNNLGKILLVESALLVFPAIGAIIYGENTLLSFALTIALLAVSGLLCFRKKAQKTNIYAKEGYVIVALSWILMSFFGAMPFFFSGHIPGFVDAFFETVSGFTTAGPSILRDVESMPKSLLFWRSLTQWIGGMGILVFVIAILPKTESSSMHIMRAEVPGPTVGKLVSRLHVSARILYGIYCALTATQILLLFAGGMPLFDSIVNSLATASTGGFSVLSNSIEGYNSVYCEMVIAVFMLIFGVNFNLYYMILIKQGRHAIRSEELRWYLGIVAGSVIVVAISLIATKYDAATSFRYAFFQVASIVSTTGFLTTSFTTWPVIAKIVILFLMMTGACAGSTCGGFKISRIAILIKSVLRDVKKAINPRSIETVKLDKKSVDENVVKSVSALFAMYVLITACSILIVAVDGRDVVTTISSVIACISNVGINVVRPYGNFADFSVLSKLVLCFDMLAGRLELIPMLMLFSPYAWARKYS